MRTIIGIGEWFCRLVFGLNMFDFPDVIELFASTFSYPCHYPTPLQLGCSKTNKCCLFVCLLFGFILGVGFWTIALHKTDLQLKEIEVYSDPLNSSLLNLFSC